MPYFLLGLKSPNLYFLFIDLPTTLQGPQGLHGLHGPHGLQVPVSLHLQGHLVLHVALHQTLQLGHPLPFQVPSSPSPAGLPFLRVHGHVPLPHAGP